MADDLLSSAGSTTVDGIGEHLGDSLADAAAGLGDQDTFAVIPNSADVMRCPPLPGLCAALDRLSTR
jgi:hypothetical protein